MQLNHIQSVITKSNIHVATKNIKNQKYKFDSLKFMMAVELQYIHEDSCDWLLRFSWLLGL